MNVNGWWGEFALTPALQPVQRVQRDAPVAADLELDVRALVRALPPGKTYHVARCHALPLAHLHLGEVQVQGIEPAAVIDNDARPVGAKRLSHLHHAPGHGADRRSRRYADPDALAHDGGVVGQAIRTEPVHQVAAYGPVELPQVAGAEGGRSRRGRGRPARPLQGGQDIVEPFGVARERREAGNRRPLRGAGLGQAALVSPLERHVPVHLLAPLLPPRPPRPAAPPARSGCGAVGDAGWRCGVAAYPPRPPRTDPGATPGRGTCTGSAGRRTTRPRASPGRSRGTRACRCRPDGGAGWPASRPGRPR